MRAGSPRGRLVVDRPLLEHDAHLLVHVRVAGLPVITRQVLGLEQAGVDRLEIAADGDLLDDLRRAVERAPRVDARRIAIVDVQSPIDGTGLGTLVQPAGLLVDPRALRQVVAVADEHDRSVVLVDRFSSNYPVDAKSPLIIGAPGGFDGKVVGGSELAQGALVPLGVRLHRGRPDDTAHPVFLNIGRYGWHTLTAAADASAATRKILLGTIKPTDGIYARTNRRVSMAISRVLLPTPITPNQVTIATLVCSALAGVVMSGGTYLSFVAGGFIGWFASMLDGVDGELARAKFQASELGHWLEMACDYSFYLAIVGGYGMGFYRATGDAIWRTLGLVGAVGVVLGFIAVARNKRHYARREPGGDYYVAFQRTTSAYSSNPVHLFTRNATFLVTRAAFPYFIVTFAVLGLSKLMFLMVLVGTHLAWILTLYAGRLKPTLEPARVPPPESVPALGPGSRARPAADEL